MATSNRRQRENERLRRARQDQRRAQQAAKRRRQQSLAAGIFVLVAVIVLAVVLPLTVFHSSKKKSTAAAAATPSASASASTTAAAGTKVCDYVKSGTSSSSKVSTLPPDTKATGTPTLTMKLTEGTVTAKLDGTTAPCTVNSFEFLAAKGYFDNTTCHRLTTSGIYVLQCGDPSGTGSGGPGYTIPDENLTGAKYTAGTLAMANTGAAHSGGSQFFIVYKDSTSLPASYTPFGTITTGLDVITGIAAKGSNNANGTGDGAPNETTKISSFTIS